MENQKDEYSSKISIQIFLSLFLIGGDYNFHENRREFERLEREQLSTRSIDTKNFRSILPPGNRFPLRNPNKRTLIKPFRK